MTELISTFHIEWFQFLAQLVNFTIALAILWFMIGKPLSKALDKRKEIIEQGVENGIKSETILAQAKANAESINEEAKKESLGIIAEASHKAAAYAAEAEHRALTIEQKLVEEARLNAEKTFANELSAQKNALATKIVSLAADLAKQSLTDTAKHEEFINKQLDSN